MSCSTPFIVALVFAMAITYGNAVCSGSWKSATMTGYDNLSDDDKNPGSMQEYTGTTAKFLSSVPVVAIHEKNFPKDKYRNIQIQLSSGKTFTVQSWDECADADCDGCCTQNANANGGYLVDVERRTLAKQGIKNWDNTFEKVKYRICDKFDPVPIAKKYHLHQ